MVTPLSRLSQLEKTILAYRQALLAADDKALTALQTAYTPSRERLLAQIEQTVAQMTADGITTSEAAQLGRARELLRLVEVEVSGLAQVAGQTIPTTQAQAVAQALERARMLTIAQGLDVRQAARLSANWTAINTNAVADLVGSLSDGSPLDDWLNEFVPDSVQVVKDTLIDGVARGIGPEALGRTLAQATDLPLHRAMTLSRSATMDAYRSASIRSYAANQDILKPEWEWSSALDSNTCNACIALHGKRFPITIQFQQAHRRCRCSNLPVLRDDELLPRLETGQEWFDRQPEAVRRQRFTPGLRGDYDAGRIDIQDMAHLHQDDTWGDSYQVSSITQARAAARRRQSGGSLRAAR